MNKVRINEILMHASSRSFNVDYLVKKQKCSPAEFRELIDDSWISIVGKNKSNEELYSVTQKFKDEIW
ncbi:MAG: hypothetical protein LBN34_07095 [Clostridiales Family XIII bacterium]|jgi:hypothetical protein|nr:hypothetical protein [Clostridiales Family XIII bacterium]